MWASTFRILAAVLLLVSAACSDDLVAPEVTTGGALPAPPSISGQRIAASRAGAFPCYTSVRTPTGPHRYRYGRLALDFPRRALASDGSTVQYRFRVQREGEEPTTVANCVIPNTPEAVLITHRRFGVGKDARVTEERRGGSDGEMTIQMCGRDGERACELEAIDVVVEGCSDPDWTRGGDGVCRSDRGGTGGTGDGSWGGSDGGGDDPDPGTPPTPCNDARYPALSSPEVQQEMQAMWAATDANQMNQDARVEQSGWLVATPGGGFAIEPWGSSGVSHPCHVDFKGQVPANAVGYVHTHPWRTGEKMESCGVEYRAGSYQIYRGNASSPDVKFIKDAAAIRPAVTQGYVMDKNGISVFSPQTRSSGGRDARIPRCNY